MKLFPKHGMPFWVGFRVEGLGFREPNRFRVAGKRKIMSARAEGLGAENFWWTVRDSGI